MIAALAWLLAALAATGAARALDEEGPGDLERWLAALDAAREPGWSDALDALRELGEPASERALDGFESAPPVARRARARLLSEVPPPAHVARVLALLGDADPEVRRLLAEALGSAALAETAAAERAAALERLLVGDPSPRVRGAALGALVESALSEAVPVLDRALALLPAAEAEAAAAALAQIPSARELLIARVTAAFDESAPLADGVLAGLLRGYGRALAEVPGGGDAARERLPFVRALSHPSSGVQGTARSALAAFLARAAELSEPERGERVLERLGEEGWPPVGCLSRRLDLAWRERGDPAAALELAREMLRAALALAPEDAEMWEPRARMHEGAALYALGQAREAEAVFSALVGRLEASRARRDDLFPGPRARATEGGGAAYVDRRFLAALARVWLALLELERDPASARVSEQLRAAHVLFLESRVVALRTGATDPAVLDTLFEHDLSPHSLVLFNDDLDPARRARGLDLARALGEAFARVAPLELQGLGAAADAGAGPASPLSDVFADPERRALLEGLRAATLYDVEKRIELLRDPVLAPADVEARTEELDLLRRYRQHLLRTVGEELTALKDAGPAPSSARLREIHAQLLDYLAPSLHAHTLAGEMRAEGRTRESRELCERALAVLSRSPIGPNTWAEISSARFEMLRGSTLMDENRPKEAEDAYLAAEARLEAIEAQARERRGSAGSDAAENAQLRALRGDALLSLAVNANVRMGEPKKALEYFERAYELNQSPFMRVLRACYRARSGRHDEARTVLRGVVPVPSLYYNIACTHALLGEKDMALDFLERDLTENHPTEGSRAQKIEWTRKDPDLASLRGEPRFERLLGTAR